MNRKLIFPDGFATIHRINHYFTNTLQNITILHLFLFIIRAFFWGSTLVIASWVPTSFAQNTSTEDIVYLQLRWHHQFQFAGYYAAIEKGFYRDEGLDVRLRSGDPEHQPIAEVLSGRAYAQGNSEVLYQRLQGEPLVALASIFQHSPSVLLTLKTSGIRSVHDLVGKKVMMVNKNEDADFLAMFINEGITLAQLNVLNSSYQINDLISGKVDAFNAYLTNEPYFLKKNNIAYNVINPISYSVDFYSDILFTSEEELHTNPQRVKSMHRATLKGWRYAMDNPEEIIELLKVQYKVTKTRENLRFEADKMRDFILPDLIQIGHMNPVRWRQMANAFIKAGLVPDDTNLHGFIYHHKKMRLIPYWVKLSLILAFILVISTSSITFYLHRFNRRMATTQKTLQQSEARFKALSEATYGGIAIHDNGLILECNNGLSDITGFSYAQLIGMNGLDLVAPESIDLVLRNIKTSYTHHYEVAGIHKNGSKYSLSIKGKNIIYKGRHARVIGFADISESKKAEEQLKLAASVFTHAREGIMITDSTGSLIKVNDTFSQITGYSRKEALGRNLSFLQSEKKVKIPILQCG